MRPWASLRSCPSTRRADGPKTQGRRDAQGHETPPINRVAWYDQSVFGAMDFLGNGHTN